MTSKLKIVGIEKIKRKVPSGRTAKELSNLIKENKFTREDVIDYLMKRRVAHILKKSKGQRKGFSWPSLVLLTDLLKMEKLGSASREEMEDFLNNYELKNKKNNN